MDGYIRYKGKIWDATQVGKGVRIKHPIPAELLTKRYMEQFCKGIKRIFIA
jgi:hypothetical protein